MQTFLARHASKIKGVLSGFDRVRFRGTIRWLASERGLGTFLSSQRILLKDFREWAMGLTGRIQKATDELTRATGRPLIYLPSSSERKETRAQQIAGADGITHGLIAVFKCVEPCRTFEVGPNAATARLELRNRPGKCSHLYFYWLDPHCGPVSLRLQMWLPFTVQVCLNGREWLVRQLLSRRIGFEQRDNCLVDVDDVSLAQSLLEEQLRTPWDRLLDGWLTRWHPAHRSLFPESMNYYWSAEETEWATDVMFRSRPALQSVYPHCLRHAVTTFGSGDVLRFLGRCPQVRQYAAAEILTSLKTRPEGTRVKHVLNRNSVKMYDKQEQVLRVETTINDARDMKVYRVAEGDSGGRKSWQRLRKGVADLHRRAEVSQQSNSRYLESLAAVETSMPLRELVAPVCQPTIWQGQRVRALHPLADEDHRLLSAVARGEFAINGFRNRDLRCLLWSAPPADATETKRQAARITRHLRLLRGHRLIRKVPQTHRYQLTQSGRQLVTALLVAQQSSVQQLAQLAV